MIDELLRLAGVWFRGLAYSFTDPKALFWWPTVLVALAGVALHAALNRRPGPSLRERFGAWRGAALRELPKDVACYFAYTLTMALMDRALYLAIIGGASLVFLVTGMPSRESINAHWGERLAAAAIAFVCIDFFLYWSHRLFHALRVLWQLHALHHSPPVLTPITAFRFWPPEAVVHFLAFSFGQGIGLGLANLAFGLRIAPLTWLGVNVFLIAWYLAFSHLRHSHVALAYPRWLSHVLVSPHMHQAHHSVDPAHHHGNYGTALAIWDWLFGTLYVPRREERFRFGIDAGGRPGAAV